MSVLGRAHVVSGKQGGPRLTPALPQGTPADVLYKGTITRIIGEDSPGRLDRGREDSLLKAHVIYEGKKGHVLSYEGEFCCWRLQGAGGQAGASLPAVHGPLLPRGDAPSEGSHGTREESWSLAGHVYFLGAKHMPGGWRLSVWSPPSGCTHEMRTGRHPVNSESLQPAPPSVAQAPNPRPRCPGAGPGSRVQRSVTGAKGQ